LKDIPLITRSKIKILMVGPLPPYLGGTSTFLTHLIGDLTARDIKCILLNTGKGDTSKGVRNIFKRLIEFFINSVRVLLSSAKIVHCHAVNSLNLIGYSFIFFSAKITRKKILLTLHSGDLLTTIKKTKSWKKNWILYLLRIPDVITAVDPKLGDEISLQIKKEVFIVANDIRFSPGEINNEIPADVISFIQSHDPVVSLVGAMQEAHGIHLAVEALNLLKTKFNNLGLIIIAYKAVDKTYLLTVKKLIDRYSLNENVLIPDWLPSVLSVIAKSKVLLRTSLMDGDSIAVREGLSLGISVVASDTGFRPEGVIKFINGDSFDLSLKIESVLNKSFTAIPVKEVHELAVEKYIKLYESLS
jgi:glycosyltransferase involved in cell wall biosynthesis